MTFTSIPRLQSLEYMRRQVLCFCLDSSGQDILEYYIGAYENYLGKLHYRKGGAEASCKEADRKSLPWNTPIILMVSQFRKPQFEKCIHYVILTEREENKMIYKSHINQRFFKQAVRERKANDCIFQAVLLLITANCDL